jgi:uncharacterized iron-regulated membrane protein
MRFLMELHTELLAGAAGEAVLGCMGVLFVIAIVSGCVLYAPFMRRLAFGTVRMHRPRVAGLDLHNLLGIATVVWAAVVGVTGVMNTLEEPLFAAWQADVMARLPAAPEGGSPAVRRGSLAAAVEAARRVLPQAKITSIGYPGSRFGLPRHYLVWTKGGTPLTSRLFTPLLIDAETGQVAQMTGLPWYLRVLEVSRPLHFGDYGGMPLKIIWALLDLITVVVLATGVYLWVDRSDRMRTADADASP